MYHRFNLTSTDSRVPRLEGAAILDFLLAVAEDLLTSNRKSNFEGIPADIPEWELGNPDSGEKRMQHKWELGSDWEKLKATPPT